MKALLIDPPSQQIEYLDCKQDLRGDLQMAVSLLLEKAGLHTRLRNGHNVFITQAGTPDPSKPSFLMKDTNQQKIAFAFWERHFVFKPNI